MKKKYIIYLCVYFLFILSGNTLHAQTSTIGAGNADNVIVTTSSSSSQTNGQSTISSQGFLPNLNAASRFLSQASFGGSYEDIDQVSQMGIEDWIDQQFSTSRPFNVMDKVIEYKGIKNNALNNPNDDGAYNFYFDFGYWQYAMASPDVLRQRVAFALSEIFVISNFSGFGDNAYAFGSYYDMLLDNSFGNYRDLLEDVTYHSAMGEYLTYMNNPKTNSTNGTFPDENYAREVMQLFSIGLCELNMDGTCKEDANGNPIQTYNNADIAEFAKIFTGMTYYNSYCTFGCGPMQYEETFLDKMVMVDDEHEPGTKDLLNGFTVPNRSPVDGDADISDALDNLFNHPNVGPFFGKFMIQRLVTSNPSPGYVERVAEAFNGQSQYGTTRGDMRAMIKAILLDEEARSCFAADDVTYGMLREPFVRYLQVSKAFDLNTTSGNFRNAMYTVYNYVAQKPFYSPSVFNFFQSDFQPIGLIEDAEKVAPEFQITNTQSISGYFNAINEWIVNDEHSDEWGIYGEEYDTYADEHANFDFSDELMLASDPDLTLQLLDRINMILAHGKLTQPTLDAIESALSHFDIDNRDCVLECLPYCAPLGEEGHDPNCDPNIPRPDCLMYCEDDKAYSRSLRVRMAIYLVMTSPEYLINR